MNETLQIIIAGLLVAVLIVQLRPKKPSSEASQLLKQDLDRLSDNMQEMREGLGDKLGDRLDKNQDMMLRSIQKQFSESTKLVTDVTKSLTELKETNKQVVGVTDELKTLQNILQNPKQRGVLGEFFLESVLENVLPPDRYKMQYRFEDNEVVDAAVFVDKDKILPVDSKFSLENYNRMVESKTKAEKDRYAKVFKADLKKRIDETSKYIRPDENTLDHAFMFIPSEAIYYDLLANRIGESGTSSRDLIEYAFGEKNVIIVSPTTFLAYLQAFVQGLRSLQIEEKAKDIQKHVGQLGRHIQAYETYLTKLGSSLSITVNHYNTAHKELKKIDKDVFKIAGTKSVIEPTHIDRPQLED